MDPEDVAHVKDLQEAVIQFLWIRKVRSLALGDGDAVCVVEDGGAVDDTSEIFAAKAGNLTNLGLADDSILAIEEAQDW